ncbi:hypothetical protein [Kitasatospora sp. NPDC059160]|uniref:hypothetical protein n=1 Tax=Kitasatospora sp. NPDC059160 TaxID=3346748 RepID=UPI0036ADB781
MSDTSANDTVLALLPDIPEVLAVLDTVDDPLIAWLQPAEGLGPDEEDWVLPGTLNVVAVTAAWDRILGLRPQLLLWGENEREGVPGAYSLETASTGYQRASLYPVSVPRADLAVMAGLLEHLRRALARDRPADHGDLAQILWDAAERLTDQRGNSVSPSTRRYEAEDLVADLETALQLLDPGQDPDVALLLEAIGAPAEGSTVVLSGPAAEAYDRWTGRLITRTARSSFDAALTRWAN